MILIGLLAGSWAATQEALWDPEVHGASFLSEGVPALWECGQVSSGPMGGFSGNNAYATRLTSNYSNNASSFLVLPSQDLSNLSAPMLRWMQWFAFEEGDAGQVEIFLNGEWGSASPVYGYPNESSSFSGQSEDWKSVELDLSALDNLDQVRLRFDSDASVNDDGWYVDDFSVWDGDVAPPLVNNLLLLGDTEDLDGPYTVEVEVEDNSGAPSAALFFSVDGGPALSVGMQNPGGNLYSGEIPGQEHDSLVQYWVEAEDGFNVTTVPEEGSISFRVRLPAPTDLTGPEGLVHDTHALLSWTAPDSNHTLLSYRLYRGEELLADTSLLDAEVPLLGEGFDRFRVRAVFDVGEGDPSNELVLETAVPAALGLTPGTLFQGDHIRSVLTAENLVFVQGEVSLDLGEGLELTQVDVRDVDRAVLRIQVDDDAEPGFRDVLVESGPNSILLEQGLVVVDGADRPRIERIEPPVGRQGLNLELEIWTSEPVSGVESVDLGEGIVIQEITQPAANCVRVTGWIDLKAPLGDRMVQLDDGSRVWTGQRFKVLDQAPPPVGCQESPERTGWAVVLFALLGVLRRKELSARIG